MTDRYAKGLRSQIDGLVLRLERETGHLRKPVDLETLSKIVGIEIEWRLMVPEGQIVATPEGLIVHLQSNFLEQPGVRVRQRFTWAHEICHALFYDCRVRPPKKLPRGPSDIELEALCQEGAANLLVPELLLARDFTAMNPVSSIADFERVVRDYDVSFDVALRRVHQVGCIQTGYAAFLLREVDGEALVAGVCFGGWLNRFFTKLPQIRDDFEVWRDSFFGGATPVGEQEWSKAVDGGRLTMVRSRQSRFTEVVQLRYIDGPPQTSEA